VPWGGVPFLTAALQTVGQEASVAVASYIVVLSGLVLQIVEASALFLGIALGPKS